MHCRALRRPLLTTRTPLPVLQHAGAEPLLDRGERHDDPRSRCSTNFTSHSWSTSVIEEPTNIGVEHPAHLPPS